MNAHRIIIDHEYLKNRWFTDPFVAHLFTYLMVVAAHCGFRFDGMDVETGTVLTSLKTLAGETGMSVGRVRKCLKYLTEYGEVATGRHKNLLTITVFRIEQLGKTLAEAESRQAQPQQPQQSQPQQPRQSQPQEQASRQAASSSTSTPAPEKTAAAGRNSASARYPFSTLCYDGPAPALTRQQRRQAARERAKAWPRI